MSGNNKRLKLEADDLDLQSLADIPEGMHARVERFQRMADAAWR